MPVSSLTKSKSPEELLKWMNDNLKYEGVNKGYIRVPHQVIKDRLAHCWESSELERVELTSMGYNCLVLYLQDNGCVGTHSAVIYESHTAWCWFEWAWDGRKGIHGPYPNEDTAIKAIMAAFYEDRKSIEVAFVGNTPIVPNKSEGDYVNNIHDKWKNVTKLYKKNLAIESISTVHGYKRLPTTIENVNLYKKQYYGLSHVRTGTIYNGIILLDRGDVFVAVLQCNTLNRDIQALDVSPTYRKKGIASTLLGLASSEFKCNKLTVRKTNTAAVNLYLKHGYRIVKNDGIMYHMEKTNTVMESIDEIPDELLDMVNKDKYMNTFDKNKDIGRTPIYHDSKVVGFYMPRTSLINGTLYHRVGGIFVDPEYRGKGLASKMIADFYKDKDYGLAYIEPDNVSSLRVFEKNGFIRDGMITGNRTGRQLWRMIKEPKKELAPAFLSW